MSAIDRKQRKRVGHRRFGLGRKKPTPTTLGRQETITLTVPERFDVHHIQLESENPKIGPPVPEGSRAVAYTLKHYDPEDYKEEGTGAQHVKQSKEKEDIETLVEKRDSGSLKSTAESSHAPRDYTEVTYETPSGTRIRRHRNVSEFV